MIQRILSVSRKYGHGASQTKYMGLRKYRTNKKHWVVYHITEDGRFGYFRIRWYQVPYYKALYTYQSFTDRR